MGETKQKRGSIEAPPSSASTSSPKTDEMAKKGEELKADMDDLLDEIDGVLEENAEEFVKAFVQRGGE